MKMSCDFEKKDLKDSIDYITIALDGIAKGLNNVADAIKEHKQANIVYRTSKT